MGKKKRITYKDLPPMTYDELAAKFGLTRSATHARLARGQALETPPKKHPVEDGRILYGGTMYTPAEIDAIREKKRLRQRQVIGARLEGPSRKSPIWVRIDGVSYRSLLQASQKTGLCSETKIAAVVKLKGRHLTSADLAKRKQVHKRRPVKRATKQRHARGTARAVVIDGRKYKSILQASKMTGIPAGKIHRTYCTEKREDKELGKAKIRGSAGTAAFRASKEVKPKE